MDEEMWLDGYMVAVNHHILEQAGNVLNHEEFDLLEKAYRLEAKRLWDERGRG